MLLGCAHVPQFCAQFRGLGIALGCTLFACMTSAPLCAHMAGSPFQSACGRAGDRSRADRPGDRGWHRARELQRFGGAWSETGPLFTAAPVCAIVSPIRFSDSDTRSRSMVEAIMPRISDLEEW